MISINVAKKLTPQNHIRQDTVKGKSKQGRKTIPETYIQKWIQNHEKDINK